MGAAAAAQGMKLGRLILIELVIVVILALLGLGGYYFYYQGQHYVSTDDAQLSAGLVTTVAMAPGQVIGGLPTPGERYKAGATLLREKVAVQAAGPHAAPTTTTVDVTAPVSGRVASVDVLSGQYVQAGTPLAEMVGWQGNTVVAYVPETQIGSVKVGQTVDVTVDAYPGDTFPGHVKAIVPATQAALSILPTSQSSGTFTKVTQRVPVYVIFENPDGADLYMGLSVEVRIHTGS